MNIVRKLLKKKKKINKNITDRPINHHFKNKITQYHRDESYHKTFNINRKETFIFIYIAHLDIHIGKIVINSPTTISQLYTCIQHFLLENNFLLSHISDFTLQACPHKHNAPSNLLKLNKHSNKNILSIILKYNVNKSYQHSTDEQVLPFLLHILIQPKSIPKRLYINYNNNIELCRLDECIICFDSKYLKKICPNQHYLCFTCIKKMAEFKKKKCPYCNTPLIK